MLGLLSLALCHRFEGLNQLESQCRQVYHDRIKTYKSLVHLRYFANVVPAVVGVVVVVVGSTRASHNMAATSERHLLRLATESKNSTLKTL